VPDARRCPQIKYFVTIVTIQVAWHVDGEPLGRTSVIGAGGEEGDRFINN
jgi:hypothetical protein